MNYYREFKARNSGLKITVLFDPSIDNDGQGNEKEAWIAEILADYNAQFEMDFTMPLTPSLRRICRTDCRILTHINIKADGQLDLLIVVDQMLTGFDSKWLNTLHWDKMLDYANLIQAFSRTNRLCDNDKPSLF